MDVKYPDRFPIAHLPTPIERLSRLSARLEGPELYIKRDDQTGLALGGNKTRKLEFLSADAVSQGCDTLITTGAAQSNHCRQTAAAAARVGLNCNLVLRGTEPESLTGNLLLDKSLGAHLHWAGERATDEVMTEVAGHLRSIGQKPYVIPLGGSNPIGATGYVLAMDELMGQLEEIELGIDLIAFASSSAGTQAGIVLGAEIFGFQGKVLGISVDHQASTLQKMIAPLVGETAHHLGLDIKKQPEQIYVNDGYLGGGYGVVSETEREAIDLLAREEGILLDPVYTGRAMGGLIDMIRQGEIGPDQRVLFWHTGGTPALFAYVHELL
jgi:D-cysteine desulfhydrase